MTPYQRYVHDITADIMNTIEAMGSQPILFVGSGLAKRYMGTPSWDELLNHLASTCSTIEKGLGFYKQSLKDYPEIGEEFAKLFQEWAWGHGHNEFPEEMFGNDVDAQSYIKYTISKYLTSLTPASLSKLGSDKEKKEIKSIKNIRPHAIITTNYDKMIELIFPDHEPIIGQQILRGQQLCVGEIYKIHGSVDEYNSLLFTKSDYEYFTKRKKFLSAKLLTFFNEHPLLFVGYSASDQNIKSILSDIDEALPTQGGIIPNVYILEWNENITGKANPPREKIIPTEDGRSVRVKLIEASDFGWVFDAFAANPSLKNVNPKILRSLIARSYDLIRHDIPKMTVEADFKMLTKSVEDSNSFATLFGIANISKYTAATALFPFSATQLTDILGGKGSHLAVSMIKKIKEEKGVDIKSSDNKYHRSEKLNKSEFHKYSQDMLDVLQQMQLGLDYEIDV